MGNSVIERDEQQQMAFGDALITFETEMKAVCQSLKGHIEEAHDNIYAENAVHALEYLVELVEEIESSLPGAQEFGAKQKVLAKRIEEASEFRFTRR